MSKYERGTRESPYLLVAKKDGHIKIPRIALQEKFGIKLFIRIPFDEYPHKVKPGDRLFHFGLPIQGEESGDTLALAKIIKNGKYIPHILESQPLLSLDNVWTGTLGTVVNKMPIDEIPLDIFDCTLGDIRNHEELKERILKRYKKALPTFSNFDILSQGVSIREINIHQRFNIEI